jgi:hypothetical protein
MNDPRSLISDARVHVHARQLTKGTAARSAPLKGSIENRSTYAFRREPDARICLRSGKAWRGRNCR